LGIVRMNQTTSTCAASNATEMSQMKDRIFVWRGGDSFFALWNFAFADSAMKRNQGASNAG
jgi:hypothetical protein